MATWRSDLADLDNIYIYNNVFDNYELRGQWHFDWQQ